MNATEGKGLLVLTLNGMDEWQYARSFFFALNDWRSTDEKDHRRAERAFEALQKQLGPKAAEEPNEPHKLAKGNKQ